MNEQATPKKKGIPWWGWVLIAGAVAVPMCGVMSAMAIYGVQKYVKNAKASEARVVLGSLTGGIARCAATPGPDGAPQGLPPSSKAVPSEPPAAMKYQSAATDWSSDAAFLCAGFSLKDPQYFSYQWEVRSPTEGVAVALADLNGDGSPELRFEQAVSCAAPGSCTAGDVIQR